MPDQQYSFGTTEDLGKAIQAQYPQYAQMSPRAVAGLVLDKYPQYSGQVRELANAQKPPELSWSQFVIPTIEQMAIGAGKAALGSIGPVAFAQAATPSTSTVNQALQPRGAGQWAGAGTLTLASLLGGGGPAASRAVPSFERSAGMLDQASTAVGQAPLKVTDQLSKAASDIYEQKDFASQVPRVAQKFFQRITNPDAETTWDDARKFYTNISRLSADEMGQMNPNTKRLMGNLRVALDDALQQMANEGGVGQQYRGGMQGYRSAAQWAGLKERAADAAKDYAAWAARGAIGGSAWRGVNSLYDLLSGGK